jgi:murein DD-endopeptidase MepM/ murein hydrolase activator NlpD
MNHLLKTALRKTVVLLLLTGIFSACGPLWGMNEPTLTAIPTQPVFWTADPPTPIPTWTPEPTFIPTSTRFPPTPTPTPVSVIQRAPLLYYSQPGDSLPAVAAHFGVEVSEITSSETLPETGLLLPDMPLIIPNRLGETTPAVQIMPDSEVVYSSSAMDFNIKSYLTEAGGYLGTTYREYLASTGWNNGAQAVQRIAIDNSINPRLMLALIEYESGWVEGQPSNLSQGDYPLGNNDYYYRGLFRQMMWAVQELSNGYYGWRAGTLTELTFPDGTTIRLSPELNAGTVAIQYFFSKKRNFMEWAQAIDPNVGFPALYARMFGDAWARAQTVEPLFPPGLVQPSLTLPFGIGQLWSFSGGPHSAWELQGAMAALDFAPGSEVSGCVPSDRWIVASAAGLVVRSGIGVVVLDLDNDGHEQTGWDLLYLHVATKDRIPLGTWLDAGDLIGHPSCEGGIATGTHLHFARKYNGEWVLADGPLPFTLSGWVAHAGAKPYDGTLTKGDKTIIAEPDGSAKTQITRTAGE